jgi:hypothetical protein
MNLMNMVPVGLLSFFTFLLSGIQVLGGEIFDSDVFKDYWYAGKAEITTYKLDQARYGELHEGTAILLFVTEDFSRQKHVKLDNPVRDKHDAIKVLKLNFIKKFNTGIYRYSMMDSVFTPVNVNNHPYSLKETSSSQEWCGNTFTQVNLTGDQYDVMQYSYFESEGDRKYKLKRAFLEDEIWTRIRINPTSLPVGEIRLIPGIMAARLRHQDLSVEYANASLEESGSADLLTYVIKYDKSGRSLSISFKQDFPFEIVSWEETYKSGWGDNAKVLTTRAVRDKTKLIDYWTKNKKVDILLRKELGLSY